MDTEQVSLKDIVGIPFSLGDSVATDTMAYRSSNLRVGKVTEVLQAPKPWGYLTHKVKVTYPNGSTKKDGSPGHTSVWRWPNGVVKVAA